MNPLTSEKIIRNELLFKEGDPYSPALVDESVKDAASRISAATGLPRKQVYARALEVAAEIRARS